MPTNALREAILARAADYMRRTGTTERELGLNVLGDPRLLRRISSGRATLRTLEKLDPAGSCFQHGAGGI